MSFPDYPHFLFVPGSENSRQGVLYQLQENNSLEQNSFVLIPYSNPLKRKTEPQFFKILSTHIIPLPENNATANSRPLKLKTNTSKDEYISKVKGLKHHIQQGNIYEINFCVQFFAEEASIDPVSVFLKLHATAKAPYAALFKTGDRYLLSASPELFLKKQGKQLFTKPIKGTTRRGKTTEEDQRLKDELYHSMKERTENVMAVDVARNDLSILATKGSVQVNKLYNIESFETVHQMVSTVSCELKGDPSFDIILGATFPMASMTGAPKIRAMQLIDEYENFERELYSGAMGIIDADGNFELAVIIRSIFYHQTKRKLSIAVGSAITYLSDPETEYEECLLKAQALFSALNAQL